MAAYNVTRKLSVEKDLRTLHPTIRARVLERIAQLQEEPLPRQAIKLAGGEQWYRIRVGDYPILRKTPLFMAGIEEGPFRPFNGDEKACPFLEMKS